jgi:hypothetical protein
MADNLRSLSPGRAEGELTGGNLSLVAASIGTTYEVNTKGKILFLEEWARLRTASTGCSASSNQQASWTRLRLPRGRLHRLRSQGRFADVIRRGTESTIPVRQGKPCVADYPQGMVA